MILYFFERVTDDDFVGPVIVAAGDEDEAWQVLSRREGKTVPALKEEHWDISQELPAMPARASIVYPSHYRRVAVR